MSKGCPSPSLDLLHSASTQICRKSKNSISEPFLPSEVLGKWLNPLGILENIMLGTKIIKIGPLGQDLALGAYQICENKYNNVLKIAATMAAIQQGKQYEDGMLRTEIKKSWIGPTEI